MAVRGGKRPGAGRKPLDATQRKQAKTIWLSPDEQNLCLQLGETVQDGIKHLIQQAMKRQSTDTTPSGPLDEETAPEQENLDSEARQHQ